MSRYRVVTGLWVHGLWVSWALSATCAYAQVAEQVIDDPELGPAAAASTMDSSASSGGEIVEDPELAGAAKSSGNTGGFSSNGDSPGQPPPSELHFTLHSRANRDLSQDYPDEDVWESTTLLSVDATLRRSESLRFGVGFTARYHFASLEHDLADVRAQRYDLDITPTTGYVDATIVPGLQVRAGYQPVQLGRFDLFTASNVLSVADLRDGAATIPGRPEVGQIALLVDYTPVSWFSLRAIYVPFFQPHIVSLTDSDYAMFPGRQASGSNAAFSSWYNTSLGVTSSGERQPSPADVFGDEASLLGTFKSNLLRSARDGIATSGLSAFTPEPRLNHPQGALRATAHGTFGELAATFATALEHLPFFRISDATIEQLSGNAAINAPEANPISVEYSRYAVASVDASFDIEPISLGFELAYQFHRAQYALGPGLVLPGYYPDRLSIPRLGFTDIVQGGIRAEFTQSTTWLLAVEAFASYAVALPDDPARSWVFLESGRWMRGVGGIAGYNTDFGLTLQLGAAWLSGPSVVFVPRVAYEILSQLTVEVGAFIIDGQTPPTWVSPVISMGGIWNNLDHVFVGLRLAL